MRSVLHAVREHVGELPRAARRAVLASAVVVPVTVAFVAVFSLGNVADAHGSLESPPSRIYHCRFAENPERPTSAACQAAVAVSGVQAVYDWNEVNQPNANGNHRAVVPDGQLCSGGRDKYRGFDLPRPDWPATRMTSGAPYHFRLLGTAAHVGTAHLYITRDGYDPTQPLRWSDLEPTPFLSITRTQYPADYSATAQVPAGKTGRHVIYLVWQRTDSPEAFYACSDVDFGGGGHVPPVADDHSAQVDPGGNHDSHGSTNQPGPGADQGNDPGNGHGNDHADGHGNDPGAVNANDSGSGHGEHSSSGGGGNSGGSSKATEWAAGTAYPVGALVRHGGRVYRCIQAHTAQPGWEPPATPALWVGVADIGPDGVASWQPQTAYGVGQVVRYDGRRYRCRQAHVSLPGWEPPNTPALWEPVS
jgi:chitin-binding protein